MAEPEEIEEEQKKLESKFNPIMVRVYQAAGGAPGPTDARGGGMPGGAYGEGTPSGSTNVEDLD